MNNNYKKDVAESIKDITQSIKDLSDCTVLKCPKWLCKCTYICWCIQIIAPIIVIILGYGLYTYESTIIILISGTILCILSITGSLIGLIHIRKMSRFVMLTAGYEKAIQKINRGSDTAELKMKHTAAVYQHYCQSLTKK